LQLESDVLIEVVEPYLLKTGFIIRTSQGRKVTERAYRHLNIGNFDRGLKLWDTSTDPY